MGACLRLCTCAYWCTPDGPTLSSSLSASVSVLPAPRTGLACCRAHAAQATDVINLDVATSGIAVVRQ